MPATPAPKFKATSPPRGRGHAGQRAGHGAAVDRPRRLHLTVTPFQTFSTSASTWTLRRVPKVDNFPALSFPARSAAVS